MAYGTLGRVSIRIGFGDLDPVRAEVQRLLELVDAGETVDASCERQAVDLKEEAGRRDPRSGTPGPGGPREEPVARQMTAAAACMANTPGGGALLVGIADDGTLVGASSDAEWLRQRVYERTQRLLTPDVIEVWVRGIRLLVVICPYAVEPIRLDGRIRWRVNDHCVDVDAATWHAKRMSRLNYDWSGDASNLAASSARPQALGVARDFLAASSAAGASELAAASDLQLLRRLNALTGDGMLTNAGVIAFVGRGQPAIDYIRRDVAGGDSTARVRRNDRSLLEEIAEVFLLIDAHNATRHVQEGLVVAQVEDLPRLAAREAVVNGLAHREWGVRDPTVVEHVGRTLRVTNPGGFFGGVTEKNILTHPSTSRNSALTLLLADLHVAEREGIGVDRMVREMVRVGHQAPVIREISGPRVRTSLVGDVIDLPWIGWLAQLEPRSEATDVNSLLLLRRLVTTGWVDLSIAADIIQLVEEEAEGAIVKLGQARLAGEPLLQQLEGVPAEAGIVWRLTDAAKSSLDPTDVRQPRASRWPSRRELAVSYARSRGRISSTELASLASAAASNVGSTLKDLHAQGLLEPSSPAGRGRGFFYRWIGDATTPSGANDRSVS